MHRLMLFIIHFLLVVLLLGCSTQESTRKAQINLEHALNWLTINKHREGVKQTPSGLQYKILKESSGCKPTNKTTVKVNYDMRVATSNQLVDYNYQLNKPSKLRLSKVIKGWQEGVPLMRVGEIWEFYIPPELAYGTKKVGNLIKPNTALVSRVLLLDARNCKK